jgi:hypothetical protein
MFLSPLNNRLQHLGGQHCLSLLDTEEGEQIPKTDTVCLECDNEHPQSLERKTVLLVLALQEHFWQLEVVAQAGNDSDPALGSSQLAVYPKSEWHHHNHPISTPTHLLLTIALPTLHLPSNTPCRDTWEMKHKMKLTIPCKPLFSFLFHKDQVSDDIDLLLGRCRTSMSWQSVSESSRSQITKAYSNILCSRSYQHVRCCHGWHRNCVHLAWHPKLLLYLCQFPAYEHSPPPQT